MIRILLCAGLLLPLCLHAQEIQPWLLTPAVALPDTLAKQVKKARGGPIVTIVDKPHPSPTGDAHD